ncbi:MAG: cupredoxin domain-containing protein [Actinomycetota bacterium]|nr:cupredoxin domain-containing protein [Actinomycetota bacterium]
MNRRSTFLAALAFFGVIAVGCSGDTTDRRTINAAAVNGKPGFAPEVVQVKKGDEVDLTVGNTTDKTHGFSIDGYGVKATTVDPGKPIHVKFTANKTGTYKVFCQLHPAHQSATFQVD